MAAMAVAGLMTDVWLVPFFLTVAGGCDTVTGIFRSTKWNQSIPEGLRGRLAGIGLLSYSAGPQLGQVRPGGVAATTTVRTSAWTGGVACVAAVGPLALSLPKLMSYDARTDPHARRVREQRAATAAEAEGAARGGA